MLSHTMPRSAEDISFSSPEFDHVLTSTYIGALALEGVAIDSILSCGSETLPLIDMPPKFSRVWTLLNEGQLKTQFICVVDCESVERHRDLKVGAVHVGAPSVGFIELQFVPKREGNVTRIMGDTVSVHESYKGSKHYPVPEIARMSLAPAEIEQTTEAVQTKLNLLYKRLEGHSL